MEEVIYIVIIVTAALLVGFIVDKYSCSQTATKLSYKYEYSVWTGCVLDDGNRKFLLEQLREVRR